LLSPLLTQQTGHAFFKRERMEQVVAEFRPDGMHYHNISLLGVKDIFRIGEAIRLYTIHEQWIRCPVSTLFQYNRQVCEKKECLPCQLAHGRPPQWWRLGNGWKQELKRVDTFIAPTAFTAEEHRKDGFDLPLKVLPNFVEYDPAEETPYETPEGPFFLYAGRLERLKGVHELIRSFCSYRKANLLIAGTGGQLAELRRLARGANNIHFLGHRTHGELQYLYGKAVANIFSSLAYETFGYTIAEAAAHGTPSIVRMVGGPDELVKAGNCGMLYRNETELHAALDRMLEDKPLRDELGRNGLEAAQRIWSKEAHLREYLSLVESIRREKGGKA
jgi:glycosyltransferase involved in cell wall biosynthesis